MKVPKEYAVPGVYRIVNIVTNKSYIGSSVDMRRRIREHFSDLRCNRHQNPYLQASFSKHGEELFAFEVVEVCSQEVMQERETYWIHQYHSYVDDGGYNIEAPYRGPVLEETRRKISEANKGKVRTPEMRQAASEQRKGQVPWNAGITKDDPRVAKCVREPGQYSHSEETRRKISENRKGVKPKTVKRGFQRPDEFKQKCRERQLSKYQDEEARKAHSERMKQWWAERKNQHE